MLALVGVCTAQPTPPFAAYGTVGAAQLARLDALLERLGVKERPGYGDAVALLRRLAGEVGHRKLDEAQVELALACWRVIERDLDTGEVDESELT